MANVELTTVREFVHPEKLFRRLVVGGAGYFSLCGFVFKKSALEKTGYMNEKLLVHQDTDFIFRTSAVAKLLPGRIDQPVVLRRVHTENRISKPRSKSKIYQDRIKMWKATYYWFDLAKLKDKKEIIFNQMLKYCKKSKPLPFEWMNKLPKEIRQLIRLSLFFFEFPSAILNKSYWNSIFLIKLLPVIKRNFRKLF